MRSSSAASRGEVESSVIYSRLYPYKDKTNTRRGELNVTLRVLDTEEDLLLVHQWMNEPHVEEFWQQAWSVGRIATYLKDQIASYHEILIVSVNGFDVAYTELYPVAKNALSECCEHHPSDWGWHLLIGPPEFIGCGLSAAIGHAIVSYLFAMTDSTQVFCEPDHRNTRMIKYVKRLAHDDIGIIQLGPKTAQLMRCEQLKFITSLQPNLEIDLTSQRNLKLLQRLKL